jgi:hypothetical protein
MVPLIRSPRFRVNPSTRTGRRGGVLPDAIGLRGCGSSSLTTRHRDRSVSLSPESWWRVRWWWSWRSSGYQQASPTHWGTPPALWGASLRLSSWQPLPGSFSGSCFGPDGDARDPSRAKRAICAQPVMVGGRSHTRGVLRGCPLGTRARRGKKGLCKSQYVGLPHPWARRGAHGRT